MKIEIRHDSAQASVTSGQWLVLWEGKIVKRFYGDNARAEAQDLARELADDCRWSASNRD